MTPRSLAMSLTSKTGLEDEVAHNVERGGNVLVENLNVEADAFFGGEGVHISADGVDLAGDFFRGAVLGPFKDHVLDEMGYAVPFGGFIARASLQPDSDGGGADVLHLFGDDRQPIGELLAANVPDFLVLCVRRHKNYLLKITDDVLRMQRGRTFIILTHSFAGCAAGRDNYLMV